ncbi:hypothetical protein DCAR_0625327 [Daucus carota subsp. sativus]|uniref:Alcohol dehydrogenase-like N-terminal domain-containing protein n=1 Tax=Daucus carota subsp. sativus TaxID=79200 RepID=A0A161ZX26_DAUCS|nr:hypothetical protein DCAR_0625327 [Daucus carota subsp. sativus]
MPLSLSLSPSLPLWPLLPIILGRDVSAEVADVGSSVKSLHVGQEIFGALHPTAVWGTYADNVILSEGKLAPKPSSISHVVSILYDITLLDIDGAKNPKDG